MKTFAERLAEDRRLVILRTLEACAMYEASESFVVAAARDCGHAASLDQVRADFAWLKKQGLLTTEDIAGVAIATLTQRGVEAAEGIVTVPGVKRPAPR